MDFALFSQALPFQIKSPIQQYYRRLEGEKRKLDGLGTSESEE
jgi:hypothetical protein